MAHIKMNFDGLLQQAATLGILVQNYEAMNQRMRNLAQLVTSGWEGEASKAYAEMMQKYILQANEMTNILQAFKSYANKATTDFQTVDQECASLIRNAF